MTETKKSSRGFTLIEILLVIGMIVVLAAVVFVALDPAKRFQDARNAKRATDAQSLLSAIQTSIVDTQGTMPAGITTTEKQIGTAGTGCAIATGGCAVVGATEYHLFECFPTVRGMSWFRIEFFRDNSLKETVI